MRTKSTTDLHWDDRAKQEADTAKVNIADTVQRDLELDFIFKHLDRGARILEVGCGNGYVSSQLRERVAHVDSFDYAENMIERARSTFGETNNRFFHDSILDLRHTKPLYDIVVCVRVLINLRNLAEQKAAVGNMARQLRPGGKLILMEGYSEGFDVISALREQVGLPRLKPAAINYYSALSELLPSAQEHFILADTFNTGLFDFLTRIVHPSLDGPEKSGAPGEFHSKIEKIVHAHQGPDLARFARLHGHLFVRK